MDTFNEVKETLHTKFGEYQDFNIIENRPSYTVFTFKKEQEDYRIISRNTSITGTERQRPQLRVFWDKIKEHASKSKELNEKFFCAIHCSSNPDILNFDDEFSFWEYIVFLESDFNVNLERVDIRAVYDELEDHLKDGPKDYIKIIVPDIRNPHVKYASAFKLENIDKIDQYLNYYDNRVNSTFAQTFEEGIEVDYDAKSILYNGAPGTGKSYQLNSDALEFNTRKVRITFYPNLTYGQFVGVFKPYPEGDSITYRYIPGPLLKQLVNALLDEDNNYLLIIEELNRGNASAIFGDTFQLFDRNQNGQSEFPIHIDYDLNYYFENEVYPNHPQEKVDSMKSKLENGLIFPSNFYIWATMNNADQGVLPMDTAFTRRWDKSINIGINDAFNNNKEEFETYNKIEVKIENESSKKGLITWNDMRQFINRELTKMRVPEDKLLGPYFISRNILQSSNDKVTETFKDKVLSYLFEDAIKQRRTSFFTLPEEKLIYSELVNYFEKIGIKIFHAYEEVNECIELIDSDIE